MIKRNCYLLKLILAITAILAFTVVFNGCSLFKVLEQTAGSAMEETTGEEDTDKAEDEKNDEEKVESAEEEPREEQSDQDQAGGINYKIAYFEVGSSEDSNHFEHRLAEIYSVNPDGSGKELVYSDIDEKYDLSRIYQVSPGYSRISCGFYEGGRGAYGALAVIDVLTGALKNVIEFDYTNDESQELLADIYGSPVWMWDSRTIAYEIISEPFSNNFRDAGIHIVDIETGEEKEVGVGIEGLSARSTTFLNPVLFTDDNSRIFAIDRIYSAKEEEGEVLGYSSRNVRLMLIDIANERMEEILAVSDFENELAVFDNFKLLTGQDRIVFQVLGDFEEDGDIWICSTDGSNLTRLTANPDLREQQPSIFENSGGAGKVAYIGSLRYGTISSQIPSGDVYIMNIDGSDNKKLTEYGIGPAKPIISPDGRFVAFINHIYGENQENIDSRRIEVFDTETSELIVVAEGYGIFDLAGWITDN